VPEKIENRESTIGSWISVKFLQLIFQINSSTNPKNETDALLVKEGMLQICSTIKLKFQPFLVGICMGGTLRMSNFKFLSIFSDSWTPK
jgi:hypothetical protein